MRKTHPKTNYEDYPSRGILSVDLVWMWDEFVVADDSCWYYDVESDDQESVILDSYSLDNRWHEMSYYKFKE
jgi:hypothetical protein